jgi:hypothetical protein
VGPIGPSVHSGAAPRFAMVQTFAQSGKLIALRDTQQVNLGSWTTDTTEVDEHFLPQWAEVRGDTASASVVMVDSLEHDGWGRVLRVKHLTDGTLGRSETYAFTREGGLAVGTWDEGTMRLRGGVPVVVEAIGIERQAEHLDLRPRPLDLRVADVPEDHGPHQPREHRDDQDDHDHLDERESPRACAPARLSPVIAAHAAPPRPS